MPRITPPASVRSPVVLSEAELTTDTRRTHPLTQSLLTGTPIEAGLAWSADGLDATEPIYGIVASGTCETRILELGL